MLLLCGPHGGAPQSCPFPGCLAPPCRQRQRVKGVWGAHFSAAPLISNDHGACWVLALAFEATPSLLGCMEYSF